MLDIHTVIMALFICGLKFRGHKSEFKLETLDEQVKNNINENKSKLEIKDLCDIVRKNADDEFIDFGLDHVFVKYCDTASIDEYEAYTQVENHMNISIALYMLNKQCLAILKSLETNKSMSKKRNTATDDLSRIYNNLNMVVNSHRLNTDFYTTLLNYLDEVMFDDCKGVDCFYVSDESYNLECMYYNHETWIKEIEWHEMQNYRFMDGPALDIEESTYILMTLEKYSNTLKKIKNDFTKSTELHIVVRKMLDKITDCIDILKPIIDEDIALMS